ncbi:MAG: polyprenyl synthetase family protein [Alphaproteobacteria bacterium]|nr:polyprenyl synthetase family protein [Alphaproteobacteria bacterium]
MALQETSELLVDKMDKLLPSPGAGMESKLFEAMRYSVLAPGKRLRPFLTVTSAGLFGVSKGSALQVAAAVEFIHAYSLIHDDLPALDNDDTRRGMPSCHKQFDEATALLAGDALLTLAFEVLADDSTHNSHAVRIALIKSIAKAAGCNGMVGGQIIDLLAEKRELNVMETTRLQRMKTGEMFAVSCEAGAILGNASVQMRNVLKWYAHDIGLAFQITDDLLDIEGNEEKAGKKLRKDKTIGKATLVRLMGVDKAKEQARMLTEQAKSHLEVFGKNKYADVLRELVDYIRTREY